MTGKLRIALNAPDAVVQDVVVKGNAPPEGEGEAVHRGSFCRVGEASNGRKDSSGTGHRPVEDGESSKDHDIAARSGADPAGRAGVAVALARAVVEVHKADVLGAVKNRYKDSEQEIILVRPLRSGVHWLEGADDEVPQAVHQKDDRHVGKFGKASLVV